MRTTRTTAVLGLPIVLALAACGGTSDAADSDAAPSDEVATLVDGATEIAADESADPADELSPDEAALELSQCLRDQGLDVADIGVDAEGNIDLRSALDSVNPGDEGFRDAMDACREIIESAGFGGGRRGAQFDDPAVQDAFLAFSECIREQGFEDVADLSTPAGRGERPEGAGEGAGADGDGPPEDGAEGGRGQRNGDFGDRASRLAERLGLDPDDPEVTAAIEMCQPILDDALGGAAPGAAPDAADAEA